jgi:hypothetical protein
MSRPLAREQMTQLLLRQQRECRRLNRGRKPWQRGVWVTARGTPSARLGATSVPCSNQVPKAAVTYKQCSLDSKVYALEVVDKVMPASARR